MNLGRFETNKIYNEDCYKGIKDIPDSSIDLIIIDPPYEFATNVGGGAFGSKNRDYHSEYSELSAKEHGFEGFNYELLDDLDRVMKNVNIYIWCNKNQISYLMRYYKDKGRNVDLLVWGKTNPIPTCNNKYLSDLEYCVFARDKCVRVNGTYETKSKFYVSPANVDDKELYEHPTIKPLEKIKHFILNSSNENDIVLDCFMGSGTTAVACKDLNRQYIGFEINEKYFKIAQDRINGVSCEDRQKKEIGQLTIFDFIEE